jgi:antitoxin component of MazEF toxin-antitoxin module
MVQKVIKIGDSLGVTIPKSRVNDLGLTAGDKVEFEVRKKVSSATKHEELLKDLDSFMATYDQDLKNLAKR